MVSRETLKLTYSGVLRSTVSSRSLTLLGYTISYFSEVKAAVLSLLTSSCATRSSESSGLTMRRGPVMTTVTLLTSRSVTTRFREARRVSSPTSSSRTLRKVWRKSLASALVT